MCTNCCIELGKNIIRVYWQGEEVKYIFLYIFHGFNQTRNWVN